MYSIYLLSAIWLICITFVESTSLIPFPFAFRALTDVDWQCKEDGWSCKDCNTLQRCKDSKSLYTVRCRDQQPSLPYCSPKLNKCVDKNDDCQRIVNDEFECPDIGTYPNLLDCKQYNQCVRPGGKGILSTCLANTIYDHNAKGCRTGAKCYTSAVDCGDKEKIAVYPFDTSLYFICRGLNKLPLLQECPSKKLYFNLVKMECDYNCSQEGNFANPIDKKKYYVCIRTGNQWQTLSEDCGEDEEFNEKYGFCMPTSGPKPSPPNPAPPTPAPPSPTTPEPTTTTTTTPKSINP